MFGFLSAIGALLSANAITQAQGVFKVKVVPKVVSRSADSLSLTYIVSVLPGSTDSLAAFIVDAPGTVLHVVEPKTSTAWTTMNHWRRRGTAEWALLEGLTRAGGSTPALTVSGRGVLDIVEYWAQPDTPRSSEDTDTPADTVTSNDTIVNAIGVRGLTIGIVAPPTDRSPAARIARLDHLITQACDVGWITDSALCARLHAFLQAKTPALLDFLGECARERSKHINENAYLVFSENLRGLVAVP